MDGRCNLQDSRSGECHDLCFAARGDRVRCMALCFGSYDGLAIANRCPHELICFCFASSEDVGLDAFTILRENENTQLSPVTIASVIRLMEYKGGMSQNSLQLLNAYVSCGDIGASPTKLLCLGSAFLSLLLIVLNSLDCLVG